MCSRYFIYDEKNGQIRDIRPCDEAEVWLREAGVNVKRSMKWGYTIPGANGVVYNARAESVQDKPLFRDSIASRRCVIPAAGFYEWNRLKEKSVFRHPDGEPIFYAGCFKWQQDSFCFVILTTEANEAVKQVHDRMPLILTKTEAEQWLKEGSGYQPLLKIMPGELKRHTEFEQQTLQLF